MMNFGNSTWRNRRSHHNLGSPYGPMHYSISSFSTDSKIDMKSEMKSSYCDEELIKKFNAIPEPIRKNLAETVVTVEENNMKKKKISPESKGMYYNTNMNTNSQSASNSHRSDLYQSIAGITGIITNFFGALSGAMFHRRSQSPVSQYYECFDHEIERDRERSPSLAWQMSKFDDQNKNERVQEQFSPPNDNMNNCRSAASNCEDKLAAVRNLLTNKTVPTKPKVRARRPRRVFVDPNSVEEQFEDAFSPEDFVSLANEDFIEYYSVCNNQNNEFCQVEVPLVKLEVSPQTSKDKNLIETCNNIEAPEKNVDTDLPVIPETNTQVTGNKTELEIKCDASSTSAQLNNVDNKINCKQEIITSCEDKMARLKLLLEKRKKNTKTDKNSADSTLEPVNNETGPERVKKLNKMIPIEKKQDKKFKNPHRLSTDKRKRCKLRRNIQDDMLFANEIDTDDIASSADNSPSCCPSVPLQRILENPCTECVTAPEYFDEVKGRFRSTSTTESEDSFQIVFSDSPKAIRRRKASDCDSEDSFIVFEDSPDSCYTTNDVFGDDFTTEGSDSECTDSESDVSDSGCVTEVCKLSHSFSRTVSDLTDNNLYNHVGQKVDNDEVDCAVRTICEVLPEDNLKDVCDTIVTEPVKKGLLLTEARKLERRGLPVKSVSFSSNPPKVHVMRVWAFAARQARAGHWERHSLDRERFKRRIADVDMAVAWVLKPQHRSRVMFQRFMPWWNAQRRKETAEKKQKEEADRIKKAEEDKIRKAEEDKATEESKLNVKVDGKIDEVNYVSTDKVDTNVLDENLKWCHGESKENLNIKDSIKVAIKLENELSNENKVNDSKKSELTNGSVIISECN